MAFPLTSIVRIKHMLETATYKRIKWRLFRVHYQYIFGNTKRYFYDFFMICCGPAPLAERMRDEIVGDRTVKERVMNETIAAIIWAAGMVLWFAIRYPHQRRARKVAVVSQAARS